MSFLKKTEKWKNGIIPFDLVTLEENDSKYLLQKAILEWNKKTIIHFIPYDLNCHNRKIEFTKNTTNNSASVGMTPNGKVNINPNNKIRAIHELGHVLGFSHEHQRSDRDEYISLKIDDKKFDEYCVNEVKKLEGKVEEKKLKNFRNKELSNILNKHEENDEIRLRPFSFDTCMIYWSDHSNKGMVWEDLKDPSHVWGTPEEVTDTDIKTTEKLYRNIIKEKDRETLLKLKLNSKMVIALYSHAGGGYLSSYENVFVKPLLTTNNAFAKLTQSEMWTVISTKNTEYPYAFYNKEYYLSKEPRNRNKVNEENLDDDLCWKIIKEKNTYGFKLLNKKGYLCYYTPTRYDLILKYESARCDVETFLDNPKYCYMWDIDCCSNFLI